MKLFLLLLICAIYGCATVQSGQDPNHAIIVRAENTTRGIRFEHEYTAKNYPGSKWVMQQLKRAGNRMYDVITIVTLDGKQIVLWFDINNFYGKW